MYVTVCGKSVPDEGVVTGYDNRIWDKNPAKWGVQIAGMIFQTRSRQGIYPADPTQFSGSDTGLCAENAPHFHIPDKWCKKVCPDILP